MMFENLLIESDLKIQLNDRHQLQLKSVPHESQNILELKIPNVVAGVELLKQAMALKNLVPGDLDQQFSQTSQYLSACNTRVDIVFLNQKLVSLGKGASPNAIQKLLAAFPPES
ncbi:hypothetical protein [Vampirovibrio sp.]|uniref:hypothetical protein n=1 Tax=Vampirovibrio sp. TaxID=2717857 RepID=UPI0035946862